MHRHAFTLYPARLGQNRTTVVTTKLKSATGRTTAQLPQVIRAFQPETVLCRERQLVQRIAEHRKHAKQKKPAVPADFLVRTRFVISGDDGSRTIACTNTIIFLSRIDAVTMSQSNQEDLQLRRSNGIAMDSRI